MKRVRKYQVKSAMKQYNEHAGFEYFYPDSLHQSHDVRGNLRWFVDVDGKNQKDRIIGTTLADCLETVEFDIMSVLD